MLVEALDLEEDLRMNDSLGCLGELVKGLFIVGVMVLASVFLFWLVHSTLENRHHVKQLERHEDPDPWHSMWNCESGHFHCWED